MDKMVRVRFSDGVFVPLEEIEMEERTKLTVFFENKYLMPMEERIRRFKSAAGGWKGRIDGEALIRQIYADRRRGLLHSRDLKFAGTNLGH